MPRRLSLYPLLALLLVHVGCCFVAISKIQELAHAGSAAAPRYFVGMHSATPVGLERASDVSAAAFWAVTATLGMLVSAVVCAWLLFASLRRSQHRECVNCIDDLQVRTKEVTDSRKAVAFGLAKLSEARQRNNGMHLQRVRSYAAMLATEMARDHKEIGPEFLANLATAATLHDIGMAAIPDSVLQKPEKLTPSERRAVQMHTVVGAECLATARKQAGDDKFLLLAEQIAHSHHEHWDGSGYPHGLQGKSIPLGARITTVADVYDALRTPRPHRRARSHEEARAYIIENRGTLFDPAVVEAFINRESDFQRISGADSPHEEAPPPSGERTAAADLEFDPVGSILQAQLAATP